MEPTAFSEYVQAMAKNPKLLDGLNVSRVLNAATGGLTRNPSVLPRAYFPKAVADANDARDALQTIEPASSSVVALPHQAIQQDPAAKANIVSYDEQYYRIGYQAASPSLLRLSVAWYPGWRAFLGQTELPVIRVDHALMGVVVPAGQGEVEFRFHSRYFMPGLGITLAAAIGLGGLAWFGRSRPKQVTEPASSVPPE